MIEIYFFPILDIHSDVLAIEPDSHFLSFPEKTTIKLLSHQNSKLKKEMQYFGRKKNLLFLAGFLLACWLERSSIVGKQFRLTLDGFYQSTEARLETGLLILVQTLEGRGNVLRDQQFIL